jgi:hypothetical protein
MIRLLVMVAMVGCLMTWTSSTPTRAAELQVSELFLETARALARDVLEKSLATACKAGTKGSPDDASHHELCLAFTDVLQELALAAIDGELDEEFALARFRAFQRRAVLVAATYALRKQLAAVLLGPLRARLSTAERTVVEQSIEKATSCIAALLLERTTPRSCPSSSASPDPKRIATLALQELADAMERQLPLGARSSMLGFDLTLQLFKDAMLAAMSSESATSRVRATLRKVDERAGLLLGRLETNVQLSVPAIEQARMDLERYPEASCPSPDRSRLLGELTALASQPLEVWGAVGKQVSRGESPARRLLPGSQLRACELRAGAYQTHVHIMDALISSAQLHALLIRWRPALLSAAVFVDQLSRPNEPRLQRDVRGLLAEVGYSVLAGRIGARLTCGEATVEPGGERMTIDCRDIDSGQSHAYLFEGRKFEATTENANPEGNRVMFERLTRVFTVAAARGTCVGQLFGAAAAGDRVEVFGSLGPVCVLDPALEDAELVLLPMARRLGLALEPLTPVMTQPTHGRRLMRWSDESVDPGLDSARLRISKTAAIDLVHESASLLAHASMGSSDAQAVAASELLEALAGQLEDTEAIDPAVVYTTATTVLAKPIKSFIEAIFDRTGCDQRRKGQSKRCLVGTLAVGLYEPLLRYSAGEMDGATLLHEATRTVDQLDPLGRSPLFLSFGLAYSGAVPTLRTNEPLSHHLTVIDKWGLVHRFGKHKEWLVGGFVGGFIDALVRTALDGSQHSYWLAPGLVFGARRLWKAPFGLEAHFAGAPRSDFRDFGLAFGATLTVPFELLLRER